MANHMRNAILVAVVAELGIEDTETNRQQLDVLLRAFEKFVERNREYQDLWKEGGVEDSMHHVKHKATRVSRVIINAANLDVGAGQPESVSNAMRRRLDDAIDLINYSAFFVRNVEDENYDWQA